jgi:hypothetical protein
VLILSIVLDSDKFILLLIKNSATCLLVEGKSLPNLKNASTREILSFIDSDMLINLRQAQIAGSSDFSIFAVMESRIDNKLNFIFIRYFLASWKQMFVEIPSSNIHQIPSLFQLRESYLRLLVN